jgi:uncharacterized membrane protein YeaQ/YmgE (transglycosylase-associated protein family)
MKTPSIPRLFVIGVFFLVHFIAAPTSLQAGDDGIVDKTKEAATAVSDAVKDASRSASDSFNNLWSRLDESRLTNRTRDEVVAWVIMGVLVGAVAGMFTSLKTSGAGRLGRLVLGLAGALLGGTIVHVARLDFGWGPVLVRYEELLFSLAGAVLLIIVARLIRASAVKKSAAK